MAIAHTHYVEPWDPGIEKPLSSFDREMGNLLQASRDPAGFPTALFLILRIGLDPLRPCEKRGCCNRNAVMCACIGGNALLLSVLLLLPSLSCRSGPGEEMDRLTETRDEYGYTALDYACQYHQADCVAILAHAGVSLDSCKDKYKLVAKTLLREAGCPLDHLYSGSGGAQRNTNYGAKGLILRINSAAMAFGEAVVPYAMAMTFVGTLSVSVLHCDSALTVVSILVQLAVCTLIVRTRGTDPGLWRCHDITPLDEDRHYASYIRKECLRANAQFPKFQGKAGTKSMVVKYITAMQALEHDLKKHVCHVCRCWRPNGARHSVKAACCVQGYDHFCYFFGVDIGQRNQLYYDASVLGFNIGIPLCVVDLAHALATHDLIEGHAAVLTLPALATRTIYSALFTPYPQITPVPMSVFALWLVLMWAFVAALGLNGLYRRLRRSRREKAKGADKKNQ